jgi:hypothetical protein
VTASGGFHAVEDQYGALHRTGKGRDPSIKPIRRPTDFELALSAIFRRSGVLKRLPLTCLWLPRCI